MTAYQNILKNDWDAVLAEAYAAESFARLCAFLRRAYAAHTVFPPKREVFNAFRLTPFAEVKVVIVGQDPYPTPGAAHGLSFSVPRGVRVPPSLENIFKELMQDIGTEKPTHGCLEAWAKQGVLLLNTVLTVEARQPRSHAGKGWEDFTDAALAALNGRTAPAVFLLWGNDARKKKELLTAPQHLVLEAAHPSPLAGGRFFGCRHFSRANAFLRDNGREAVDWGLTS